MAGQIRVDEITNEAGTGSPSFPNQITPSSLGTGTPDSTNYLRGDGQWQVPPAGFSGAQTVTSSNDVTLTASSPQVLRVSMTAAGRSVNLPDATTATTGSPAFVIVNAGWFPLTVRNNAGLIVATAGLGQSLRFTLIDKSTAAGTWSVQDLDTPFALGLVPEVVESFGADSVLQGSDTTYLVSRFISQTGSSTSGNLTTTYEHRVATLSNNVLTYGSPVSVAYSGAPSLSSFTRVGDNLFFVVYNNFNNNNNLVLARAVRIVGTTVSAGSQVTVETTFDSGWTPAHGAPFSAGVNNAIFSTSRPASANGYTFQVTSSLTLRGVVINSDNTLTLGSVGMGSYTSPSAGTGSPPQLLGAALVSSGVFIGNWNSTTRVITLSAATPSIGSAGAAGGDPFLPVDGNTALSTTHIVTRSGTSISSVTALSIVLPNNISPPRVFNNVYPRDGNGVNTAIQIVGTTASPIKAISYGGTAGNFLFKRGADELISFTTGANLRYSVFRVL